MVYFSTTASFSARDWVLDADGADDVTGVGEAFLVTLGAEVFLLVSDLVDFLAEDLGVALIASTYFLISAFFTDLIAIFGSFFASIAARAALNCSGVYGSTSSSCF